MSTTFRTAVVRTPGGPDSIEIIDVPVVEPGPGHVRVEIAAAAVNPVDLDDLFQGVRVRGRHGESVHDRCCLTNRSWRIDGHRSGRSRYCTLCAC